MTEEHKERHVLIIDDDQGRRSIALDAATYSLGRDFTNAIVLESKAVSRQQALLLRLPVPNTTSYRYRLVDGNSAGRASANGMKVNGLACTSRDLQHGDNILFGGKVQASYMVVLMDQMEFVKYLDLINFQSIKSAPVNAKETLVGIDFGSEELSPLPTPVAARKDMLPPGRAGLSLSNPKVWLVGLTGIVIGLLLGSSLLLALRHPFPVNPKQIAPSTKVSS